MNPKRPATTIWVISKYFSSRNYGFETRSVAIARKWAAQGRIPVVISSDSNHLAQFPPLQTPAVDEVSEGVRFRWLRTLKYSRTASARRVLSWIDFELQLARMDVNSLPRPDVIIASSLSLLTVLNGMRLARKFNVPWVFEVRDIWPLTFVEEGGYSKWHPLALVLSWIERLGYRKADAVVGTMPNLGEHASAVARRPIEAKCVPFGYDPSNAGLDAAPQIATACAPSGPLIVGYAGSMGVSNALDTLIDCVLELRKDPRFKFVMLGDGDLRAKYMSLTAQCRNIEWVGRVPRAEVAGHLSRCDLLYFAAQPSKVWRYGMSLNKLTDYLLAAKPILGSYSGYPSIVNEARCGTFVPSDDKQALLGELNRYAGLSPRERHEEGARGRAWLEANRTWSAIADDFGSYLDGVVSARQRAAQQQ